MMLQTDIQFLSSVFSFISIPMPSSALLAQAVEYNNHISVEG